MRQHILLLDDDEAFRDELAGELEYCGHICQKAAHAEQILAPQWYRADAAIIDLVLDGDDGPAFLRRMQAVRPQPQLVLVSGHDPMVLNAAARATRALGYDVLAALTKPLSVNELLAVLEGIPKKPRRAQSEPALEPANLKEAMRRYEIAVVFQPKIGLSDGVCRGVEAQLRWDSPQFGSVSALRCTQLADQGGLAAELADVLVEKALGMAASWQGHALAPAVSIALSARLLDDPGIAGKLQDRVHRHGIVPSRVIFALCETETLGTAGPALEAITRLRLAGFGISLADFGTGQNRFERFIGLPATELTLDRRLADAVLTPHGRRIVQGIIAMCHALGMQCVAEGVETAEQAQTLRRLGCDMGQGLYLGHPQSGRAIRALLPVSVDVVC
jgi:EAL domain-containing protein (putative c-di-GMP-specific phosphodiesterase class I)/ActR/RegA family two-component response regulator